MNKNVIKYMQKIGSKGGSAKTEKQREAHKLALIAARAKRWPNRAAKNNPQLSAPTEKQVDYQENF